MSIPFPFSLGNRSEYLAIPALTKLGFTVPVPRQEDHFGVDFIVHLASLEEQTVRPTGKSFGIQIKSNTEPIIFDTQHKRDCLFNSSLPLFLGVVSRTNLTLTVYNTLNRLNCFWSYGDKRKLSLIFGGNGSGLPKPDFDAENNHCLAYTGKPILEISIQEPETLEEKTKEIEILQSTMKSWIKLENENLSLKEQQIPLFFWSANYKTNIPLPNDSEHSSYTKYASWDSFPNICQTSKKVLMALSFYLRKLPETTDPQMKDLMTSALDHVQPLEKICDNLLQRIIRNNREE